MTLPRYMLFGLVRVQMYEWYWGHTAAQIDLIDIDAPRIFYQRHNSSGGPKPGEKGYKPNAKKLEQAVERWKKRKAEREKQGFNLNQFLQTGDKIPVNDKPQQH